MAMQPRRDARGAVRPLAPGALLPLLSSSLLLHLLLLTTTTAPTSGASLPVLSIRTAAAGTWPPPSKGLYLGDVRAALQVSGEQVALATATGEGLVTAQIYWRRRDADVGVKDVVVTDSKGVWLNGTVRHLAGTCGQVSFAPTSGSGTYYMYYLPFFQSGGGAGLHFHWFNCSNQTAHECVLSPAPPRPSQGTTLRDEVCSTPIPEQTAVVVELENRPSPAGSDTVDFHGFTPLELAADASEVASMVAAHPSPSQILTFPEPANASIRMFDMVPAAWAIAGPSSAYRGAADAGSLHMFQIGVYAPVAALVNLSVVFEPLVGSGGGAAIPASALTCYNLGGFDEHGVAFGKNFSVARGAVGALWFSVDVPGEAKAAVYTGGLSLRAQGGAKAQLTVTLDVATPATPVLSKGQGDIYSMRRLDWLNSRLGIDDQVPGRFTPVVVTPGGRAGGGFSVQLVNKNVTVAPSGMIAQAVVRTVKQRGGKPVVFEYPVLGQPMAFTLYDARGAALPLAVHTAAAPTAVRNSSVAWSATLTGSGFEVRVDALLEYDSYAEVNLTVTATEDVTFGDIRLAVEAAEPRYMIGMGTEGRSYADLAWTWRYDPVAYCCGDNGVWLGRPEAGLLLKLKGAGNEWNNPLYSKDAPFIPFIPQSWGGVNNVTGAHGCNITAGRAETYSGARAMRAGESVSFLFDTSFTPSKPLNLTAHIEQRYYQVGYGTPYETPAALKAKGVTVITLHQGIPGVINGTLVNPYINYPFVPQTVALMENYTAQARALGMQVKFYYTIRELSNHAAELFALKSLNGEVVTNTVPYEIPQSGFCHDWDCHGGAAYLHLHVKDNYSACWQQALSDGEWDGAVCDIGTSQWFNYYVQGVYWSVANAPHISGIYYDGINFDRRSMQRVRKALDSAAEVAGRSKPLIDIHTGERASAPSAIGYLSHFAYADSAWNGEGFKFGNGPDYWLVDASGLQHGIFVDRLGGSGATTDFKGMLYATYQRNSGTAPALWALWDEFELGASTMVGYWEENQPVTLTTGPPAPPQPPASCPVMQHLSDAYPEACGGASGDIGFGGGCGPGQKPVYPALTLEEATATCCKLHGTDQCDGFSLSHARDAQNRSTGCFKKNVGCGVTHNAGFDGYSFATPGTCSAQHNGTGSVLVTTFVRYGVEALVVVGSWCQHEANVTMVYDYGLLGLDAGAVAFAAPAIAGLQAAQDLGDGTDLRIPANTGLIFSVRSRLSHRG